MKRELRRADWKDKIRLYLGVPGRLFALEVAGNSMSPSIAANDVVLYERSQRIEVGDIVLIQHPFMQSVKVVKRVEQLEPDRMVILVGDNPAESTDSRTLGSFPIKSIKGRVVCKLQ